MWTKAHSAAGDWSLPYTLKSSWIDTKGVWTVRELHEPLVSQDGINSWSCVPLKTSPPPWAMSERLQSSYTILCGHSVHQNYCKLLYTSLPKTFWTSTVMHIIIFTTATTSSCFGVQCFETYSTWIHMTPFFALYLVCARHPLSKNVMVFTFM